MSNSIIQLRFFLLALRKEFFVWLRDPKIFGAGIFAPLVLLVAFSGVTGGRSIKLAVTDLDDSPASQQLLESLESKDNPLGGKYFSITPVNQAEGEELYFHRQKLPAGLIIPEDFEVNLRNRKETSFELFIDNYHSDFAKNIRLYLNEAFLDLYNSALVDTSFTIREVHAAGARISWLQSVGMGLAGLAVILAGLFNGFNSP